jgi:NNP family nitrate/nitrite transporter-like MFS transporter
MTGPFVPGIFFSLLSGLLVDRFGVKRVLMFSAVLSAGAAVLRVWAGSYGVMLFCMILLGILPTFLNSNSAKIFGIWFPREKTSMLLGIFISFANIATAVGNGTSALFPGHREGFVISAVVVVAAAVLFGLFTRENRETQETGKKLPLAECLRVVTANRKIWVIAFGLMSISSSCIAVNMFIPSALHIARHFDGVSAGAMGVASPVGAVAGCVVIPRLYLRLSRPRTMMLICGLLGALGVAFAWRAPAGAPLVLALASIGFFGSSLMPILISMPLSLPEIGEKYAGTAGGFIATIQLVGSVVIPSYIVTPITGSDYRMLFLALSVFTLIFCVLTAFLPVRGRTKPPAL